MFEIVADTLDMEGGNGLTAFIRLQEGDVVFVVHEEILRQDGRARRVGEEVKVFLLVRIAVRVVETHLVPREILHGRFAEASGQIVSLRVADTRVTAPPASQVPLPVIAGGIDMDADQNHMVVPRLAADLVDAATALFQRDILTFGYQERGIIATVLQMLIHIISKNAVPRELAEVPVRTALPGSIIPVSVVDQYFHRL